MYAMPGRVMSRPAPFMPYQEVDGVKYQWRDADGRWLDQMYADTFEFFADRYGAFVRSPAETPANR